MNNNKGGGGIQAAGQTELPWVLSSNFRAEGETLCSSSSFIPKGLSIDGPLPANGGESG